MVKIKKAASLIILLTIVIVIFSLVFDLPKTDLPKVCTSKACFNVEIAKTKEERQQGLMNRDSLEEDKGMFFIFNEEAKHSFWMKDTKIPLDMIWINSAKKIVYIKRNAVPCIEDPCPIYYPDAEALYVLELNAGAVESYNIKENDFVHFTNVQ